MTPTKGVCNGGALGPLRDPSLAGDDMRHALQRRAVCALLAPLLATLPGSPGRADDASPPQVTVDDAASPPKITSKARVTIAIGNAEPQSLTVGLYGKAAPSSVKLFEQLCAGSLPGTSPESPLSYRGSTCTRIEKNKAIVLGHLSAGSAQTIERSIDSTGYVRSELVNLADRYTNTDENKLSHDRGGLISMRRGGGEFEFILTAAPNPALDASRIVIGEVVDGTGLVSALNEVPSRRPSSESEVGSVIYALGAYDESKYLAVAKAGGDPRSRIDQAFRPLQKVRIVRAEVL